MYDINGNIINAKQDQFDYSRLPYTIRKIERDDYKNINIEMENEINIDPDDMVEVELGEFDECYDSDDSTNGRECALLIQPKHYVLFSMNRMHFVWIPQDNGIGIGNDNVNWKSEYQRVHQLIRNHFDIESAFDIQLRHQTDNNNDNGVLIDNDTQFAGIWNKLIENESISCVEIVVKKIQNHNELSQEKELASSKQDILKDPKNIVSMDLSKVANQNIRNPFTDTNTRDSILTGDGFRDQNTTTTAAKTSQYPGTGSDDMVFDEHKDWQSGHNVEQEMSFLLKQLAALRMSNKKDSQQQSKLDSLCQLFDHLFESLRLEGFSENGSVYKNATLSKNAMLQESQWEMSCKHLKEAMSDVQSFDIEYMLDLYDKTENAAKQVLNEDVVIVLGHTGAGKSTTIHFLAGSQMVRDQKSEHIYPEKVINPALSNVKTEFRMAESVTRYIAGVPISLEEAGIRVSIKKNAKNKMVLCDTPGFDDTSGAEVDVANGLGIVRAVNLAKAAKILLVIGRADLDGSRMRGAKQLCYTLANIMPGFKHFLNCINIVVTKMSGVGNGDANAIDVLETWFDQALKEMKEKDENNDEAVIDLFEHIVGDLDNVVVLDPIKGDRKSILKKLFAKSTNWITNPNEHFQSFVTESSMDKIMQQILKHKQSIMKSPTNYELIDNKLTQLKRLYQVLPSSKEICDTIVECIEVVVTKWNSECNNCISTLETSVNDERSMNEFENNIQHYKKTMTQFTKYNDVRVKHLLSTENTNSQTNSENDAKFDEDSKNHDEIEMEKYKVNWNKVSVKHPAMSPELLETTLVRQFGILLTKCTFSVTPMEQPASKRHKPLEIAQENTSSQVQTDMDLEVKNAEEFNVYDAAAFEKAQIVARHFKSKFGNTYHNRLNSLRQKVKETGNNAIQLIDNDDFCGFSKTLSKLYYNKNEHEKIGDPCKINDAILSIGTHLFKCLAATTDKLTTLFPLGAKFDHVDPDVVIKQATHHFHRLESVYDSLTTALYIPMDCDMVTKTREMYETTLAALVKYCNLLCNHIKAELWNSRDDTLSKYSGNSTNSSVDRNYGNVSTQHKMDAIKSCVKFLQDIRSISQEIKVQTLDGYHHILREIEAFLSGVQREFEMIVRNLNRNVQNLNVTIDYRDLVECVAILEDSDWLFDVSTSNNDDNLDASSESIQTKVAGHNEETKICGENRNRIVKKVISKLVSHFDVLESISDTNNISIENISSLDTVDLVMKQLNKMKPLERLIKEIRKMSNDLATGVIKNIEGIIDTIIPQEDEKRNTPENVETFILSKKSYVMKLKFVKKCSNISWFEPDGYSIREKTRNKLQNLKEFISDYGKFRVEKMEQCLNFLVDIECELNNTDKAMNCGNELSRILKEFTQIDAKYEILITQFDEDNDDLLAQWRLKLTESFQDLKKKLLKLKNAENVELHMAVARAHALSKIDWFLNASKFGDLYINYEKEFRSDAGYEAIVNCIKEKKFEEIEQLMGQMQERMDVCDKTTKKTLETLYRHAQTLLSRSMHDLYDETRNYTLRFQSELQLNQRDDDYFKLGDFLKQAQASNCCCKHLNDEHKKKIEKKNENISNLLKDCVKRGEETIKAAIDSKQFGEAEKQIESFDLVSQLIDIPFGRADIIVKLNGKLEDEKKWYLDINLENKTLSPYYSNPPKKFFAALDRAYKICKRSKYTTIKQDIETDIVNKFRARLIATRSIVNRQQRDDTLQLCRSITKSIPTTMSELLSGELSFVEKDIKAIEAGEEKLIQDVDQNISKWDCNELSETYFAKVKENRVDLVIELRKLILQDMRQHSDKLLNVCDQTFDKREKEVESHNKTKIISTKWRIGSALCNTYSSNRNYIESKCSSITNSPIPSSNDGQKSIFNKSIRLVGGLIAASRNKHAYSNLDSAGDLMKQLVDCQQKLIDKFDSFFSLQTKNFKQALAAYDCEKLINVLVVMDMYKPQSAPYLNDIGFYDKRVSRSKYNDNDPSDNDAKVNKDEKNINDIIYDYDEMKKQMQQFAEQTKDGICTQEFMNQQTDLEEYYVLLKQKLQFMHNWARKCNPSAQSLINTYTTDIDDCINKINTQISKACNYIRRMSKEEENILFEKKTLTRINTYLCHFDAILATELLKHCNTHQPIANEINSARDKLENKLFSLISIHQSKNFKAKVFAGNFTEGKKIGNILVKLYKAGSIIGRYKKSLSKDIDDILQCYMESISWAGDREFAVTLKNLDPPYGSMLVESSAILESGNTKKFNTLISNSRIGYVLENMRVGHHIDSKALTETEIKVIGNRYRAFEACYKSVVKQYSKPNCNEHPIVANIKLIAANIRTKSENVNSNSIARRYSMERNVKELMSHIFPLKYSIQGNVIKLMSHIFALWTFQNSQYYSRVGNVYDRKSYLSHRPQAAQVVSIIRLLNIDNMETNLVGNLIEIRTGEGKSLILAVTACILALLGYHVNCVCSSIYLCQRNYDKFSPLFRALNVTERVRYGTLCDLCDSTMELAIDVRQNVEDLILGKMSSEQTTNAKKRSRNGTGTMKTVLLVDEVDVLFSNDFYLQSYRPSTLIKNDFIYQLADFVWQNRSKNEIDTMQRIKQSHFYKKIENMFKSGGWMALIDNEIEKMIRDSKRAVKRQYIVQNGRIGYERLGGISFRHNFGYETMFAHHAEFSKGSISRDTLKENTGLQIICGRLAFVELCKQFDGLLGVTSSLSGLTKLQLNAIKETFGINKFTYMPSLFGKNKLTFDSIRDIELHDTIGYFSNLALEIQRRLNDHGEGKRCVLVFFENSEKLSHFYKCPEFGRFRDDALRMTEKNSKDEIASIITRACMSGSVLLATKSFGLGTDFQVTDEMVENNSGPHVIQAFLGDQKTEEKQIQGRTAREGGSGSYSMILLKDEIKNKYNIDDKDIEEAMEKNSLYDWLDQQRSLHFQQKYQALVDEAKDAESMHQVSERLIAALKSGDSATARQLLEKINKQK